MEDYNLTWKLHAEEAFKAFVDLRAGLRYVDVILFCGGDAIKAHSIILAACSSYFERLLNAVTNEHSRYTVVALTRIDPYLLRLALNFMYSGKVTVPSDKLEAFMSLAELLEVRGLRSNQEESPPPLVPRGDPSLLSSPSSMVMGRGRGMIGRGRPSLRRPGGPGFGMSRPQLTHRFPPPQMGGRGGGPPPPKMMRTAAPPPSSSSNQLPASSYRNASPGDADEMASPPGHNNVIVKKEMIEEEVEEGDEGDFFGEDEEESDYKGFGADEEQDVPRNVPASVNPELGLERVGFCTFRGQTDIGTAVYFCELCGYTTPRRHDATAKHELKHRLELHRGSEGV